MTVMEGAGWVLGVAWTVIALDLVRQVRAIRLLPAAPPAEAVEPRVSIVVTARDEAARIERTLRGMLAQVGIELELIVADDRSTDATPAIVKTLAAQDPRVTMVRIDHLPPRWLGKTHACHRAAGAARGEWILFCDGDTWLAPDVVQRAVACARAERADHLCLMPGERGTTLAGRAALLVVYLGGAAFLGRANRDGYRGPVGVGAFNLVRADAYRAVGGHERLRLAVVDDAKLGLLLLRAGFRSRVFRAPGDVEVAWSGSLPGLLRAVEKNMFAALEFNTPLAVGLVLAFGASWSFSLGAPLLAPSAGTVAAALGLLLLSVPAWIASRQAGWGLLPALLAPFYIPAIAVAVARSTLLTLRRGGVRWRDTFYPLATLRQGRLR